MLLKCKTCSKIVEHNSPHYRSCPKRKRKPRPARKSKCKHCKKKFLTRNLNKHQNACRKNPKAKRCKFCNKPYREATFSEHRSNCIKAPGPQGSSRSGDLMDSGAVYGYRPGKWSRDDD